jgi:dTDP-4-dehydrorhamnose 3,5-epimerase
LHYQTGGDAEEKIVRCTSGAVHDVVLDLREASATFGKWFAIRLDAQNRKALYVPAGFAHGYQTLTDEAEVLYAISKPYAPQSARGIHHGDAALNIDWPLPLTAISGRDAHLPPLAQAETFRL